MSGYWAGYGMDVGVHGIFTDFSGLALPALLSHSNLIDPRAMVMSIIGGLLIYGTIISFTMFFQEEQDF